MSESETLHPQLLIGSFIPSPETAQTLVRYLDNQYFQVYLGESEAAFLQWISQNRHRVDCLVFEPIAALPNILENLQARDIFLPALLLAPQAVTSTETSLQAYHKAVVRVPQTALPDAERYIRDAIAQFLKLPDITASDSSVPSLEDTRHFLFSLQQQRLSEKLQERLGYLGVYYKRNRDNFLRNLPLPERQQVLDSLRADYRAIILGYFASDGNLNQKIDALVNTAFFADVSVSQIVEIHMELMDDFSKQLKLEGRSEEILLDYRLTLIDVIAHLCEMYRRSIPRDM
ncbi:MAG: circadian clock protein KaiA [Cyanobacteria bacterium J06559_3]